MANPTLTDLHLFLRNLFGVRAARLKGSHTWLTYDPLLRAAQTEIEALPASAIGPRALVAELNATDEIHDGFGGAGYFLLEAYLRLPSASAEVKAAAKRVRDALVPSLSELKVSLAEEALRAKKRRDLLTTFEADLRMFPVMGAAGEKKNATLYDWFVGQLDAGDRLDALLSDRADTVKGSRAAAAALRSTTLGTINRFRAALADEQRANPKLPKNLDSVVFGYFDLLVSMRAAGSTDEPPPPPDPPPAPPT